MSQRNVLSIDRSAKGTDVFSFCGHMDKFFLRKIGSILIYSSSRCNIIIIFTYNALF